MEGRRLWTDEAEDGETILSAGALVDPTSVVKDSTLGEWTAVGPRATIVESVLGDYSYVMENVSITYASIGKFCSIAAYSCINPVNHPVWRAALHHFTYRSRSYGLSSEDDETLFDWRREDRVVLGHDVWIGHGAILLPGVRIGTGAAIGAGTVVSRDIEPFSIAVGVPARPIRKRFDDETAEALLRIRWWDWDQKRLSESLEDFRRLSAEEFARKYDPEG